MTFFLKLLFVSFAVALGMALADGGHSLLVLVLIAATLLTIVILVVVETLSVPQPSPSRPLDPHEIYEQAERIKAEKVLEDAQADRDEARSRAQMAKAHREDTQTFLKTRHTR